MIFLINKRGCLSYILNENDFPRDCTGLSSTVWFPTIVWDASALVSAGRCADLTSISQQQIHFPPY